MNKKFNQNNQQHISFGHICQICHTFQTDTIEVKKEGYLPQTVHLRSKFNKYYLLNAVGLARGAYLATLQDEIHDPADYFGNPPEDKKYGGLRAVGYGGMAVSLLTEGTQRNG